MCLEARPIMQRLIADARARRFDADCFHKIDRIA
jgi:DNA invertase Pin-like site-specific DNA recombinase